MVTPLPPEPGFDDEEDEDAVGDELEPPAAPGLPDPPPQPATVSAATAAAPAASAREEIIG